MAGNEAEIEMQCSVCFVTDFDNLNQIIYCDICDTGVHQKCYGLQSDLLE